MRFEVEWRARVLGWRTRSTEMKSESPALALETLLLRLPMGNSLVLDFRVSLGSTLTVTHALDLGSVSSENHSLLESTLLTWVLDFYIVRRTSFKRAKYEWHHHPVLDRSLSTTSITIIIMYPVYRTFLLFVWYVPSSPFVRICCSTTYFERFGD